MNHNTTGDVSVRKNITILQHDYELISDFAKKNGYSFSEFLRKTAINYIEKSENADLLAYMNANLSYVEADEQAEFEKLNIDFDNLDSVKLTLEDVLE